MNQDFDKLLKAIDEAKSLTDSELDTLIAGLSEEERDMLNALVASKRAVQRNEARKCAESVADEAWKAFEREKFGKSNAIGKVLLISRLWLKIAAAVVVVIVISGLTLAAVRSKWIRFEKSPEAAVEQMSVVEEPRVAAEADSLALDDASQVVIADDVTLEALLERMAAHYGAAVRFADDAPRSVRLHFEWNKSLSLEQNMKLLDNFSKFSVCIENGVIIVSTDEDK